MGFLFYYVFKTLVLGSWIQDPLLSDPNQNSDKSSTSAVRYHAFLLILKVLSLYVAWAATFRKWSQLINEGFIVAHFITKYSIQYITIVLYCTLYIIHYTLYSIQYTLYIIHYTLYIIHYTVLLALFSKHRQIVL